MEPRVRGATREGSGAASAESPSKAAMPPPSISGRTKNAADAEGTVLRRHPEEHDGADELTPRVAPHVDLRVLFRGNPAGSLSDGGAVAAGDHHLLLEEAGRFGKTLSQELSPANELDGGRDVRRERERAEESCQREERLTHCCCPSGVTTAGPSPRRTR